MKYIDTQKPINMVGRLKSVPNLLIRKSVCIHSNLLFFMLTNEDLKPTLSLSGFSKRANPSLFFQLIRTAEGDFRRIWVTDDHSYPLSFCGDQSPKHGR